MKVFYLIIVAVLLLTVACSKSFEPTGNQSQNYGDQKGNVKIPEKNAYKKIIVNPIVFADNWKYPVSGTIEYWQNNNLVATIDYGNGELDSIATKTVDNKVFEFDLSEKYDVYVKVITNPIVKVEGWDYPVSGTIKYYKKEVWIATVDYGNGELDSIGTKITEDGTYTFDMSKGK